MRARLAFAAAAFALYAAASLLGGELFPLSRYDMYARAAGRDEGAVPVFLADGRAARPQQYVRFAGVEPAAIYPPGIPCSMEYRVRAWQAWLGEHAAAAGAPAGPVRVQFGFDLLSIEDGRLVRRQRIVAEGTAWPR